MDELWQRYRAFWIPVLWGVGIFLAGLVVVGILSDDPEEGRAANAAQLKTLQKRVAPSEAQIRGVRNVSTEWMTKHVESWAKALDQRRGADDPYRPAVEQALRASILRGTQPADAANFDGDTAAAAAANAKYATVLQERLAALRSEDPNVSYSRLQADVVQDLSIRANRADVDLADDDFGLGEIRSVTRSELPRRLANLALVATTVDVLVREGARRIDRFTLLPSEGRGESAGADPFLLEWPVRLDATATPRVLLALLDVLARHDAPFALGDAIWKAPAKDGLVRADMKIYSLRVNPAARLGLGAEEGQ